jgi:hypothetical protein
MAKKTKPPKNKTSKDSFRPPEYACVLQTEPVQFEEVEQTPSSDPGQPTRCQRPLPETKKGETSLQQGPALDKNQALRLVKLKRFSL